MIGYHDYPEPYNPQHLYHELWVRLRGRDSAIELDKNDYVRPLDLVPWVKSHVKEVTKLATKTGTKRQYSDIARFIPKIKSINELYSFLHE